MASSREVVAYSQDGTEIVWRTAAQWGVAGIVKDSAGHWFAARVGNSWDSVRCRTQTFVNRTYRDNRNFEVVTIFEATAPCVREYFGTHLLVVHDYFVPGSGYVPGRNMKAGRTQIRRLIREGATQISFRVIGTKRIGDFHTSELIKSLRMPKPRRCATIGHHYHPATFEISYDEGESGERVTEKVCGSCAQDYGRRPALVSFELRKL